jgi:hypothetical protein
MEKIKVKVDITKAKIDAIHKKLLVFIGVGAGSWIYVLEFAKSEIFLMNILAILFL